ncbi:MAG: flagellar filament capping protein FliD [Serpentinimonas sp.]|jgi:flagellar hook-associated protein 2|nr:flagellar filament capping protein FliD [Serpentinimonas sp.]
MGSSSLFTGSSTYSQDFIQVIERSMAIARLPLLQLQQQRLRTNDQQTAVTELQGRFQSLKLAIDDVNTRAQATQLSASFSTSGIATATIGASAQKGSFSLEVSSLGSFTSFLSASSALDPAADGLGAELSKVLVVDGAETTITLETNTLRGLADAINASSSGVEASIINVSSTSTASYKLVLQGNKLGAQTLELRDGDALGANLLESAALQAGQNVGYKLNGVSISSESRTVTLAPGVDVTFSAVTTSAVTLSVSRTADSVADSIQSMVAQFNLATGKLNEHRGAAAGALQGSSTIQTLGQVLRRITSYTALEGDFRSATDIGLRFNDQGTLNFDSTQLSGLSEERLASLLTFLGGTEGKGFLGAALSSLQEAVGVDTGILSTERSALTARLRSSDNQISETQDRLGRMEKDLRDRFAIVDSTIASLQQQAFFINNMFEAMRISQRSYSR